MNRCALFLPSLLVLVASCNSTSMEGGAPIAAAKTAEEAGSGAAKTASAAKAKSPKKPTLKELEAQLATLKEAKVEARRKARYAQAELEIAESGSRISLAEAEETTRKARKSLQKAREAMTAFDEVERPLAARKATLRIADAEHRVRSAETDLAGLQDIFAEEVEASAKPEILRRGRRDVERAREQLEITRAEVAHQLEIELPKKMAELADAVRSAEASLAQAEQKAQRGRLRATLDVEKATDGLDDARRAAKKADGKVKAKERQVNDAKRAKKKPAKGKDAKAKGNDAKAKAKDTKAKGGDTKAKSDA